MVWHGFLGTSRGDFCDLSCYDSPGFLDQEVALFHNPRNPTGVILSSIDSSGTPHRPVPASSLCLHAPPPVPKHPEQLLPPTSGPQPLSCPCLSSSPGCGTPPLHFLHGHLAHTAMPAPLTAGLPWTGDSLAPLWWAGGGWHTRSTVVLDIPAACPSHLLLVAFSLFCPVSAHCVSRQV